MSVVTNSSGPDSGPPKAPRTGANSMPPASLSSPHHGSLRVPDSLHQQLLGYRRHVWRIKILEAAAIAVFGLAAAFLIVYGWDRLADTPRMMRTGLLMAAVALMAIVPWFVYRWVWRHRGLEPLARLLSRELPAVGDQLLGVIELTHSDSEQARSPALCQAAMNQVAADASRRDLAHAAPPSHYRLWSTLAAVMVIASIALAAIYPAAAANAMSRLVMPWKNTPRYTFTHIEPLPNELVLPHGEATTLPVVLADTTRWQPPTATLQIGNQPLARASLENGQYQFNLPPQITSDNLTLRVGDVTQSVNVEPTLRPELASVMAAVRLPEYLGQNAVRRVDSRGGSVTMVRGSQAVFTATINRDLAAGQINEQEREVAGATLASDQVAIDEVSSMKFQWQDQLGLTGREPFELTVNTVDDEAPTLICDGLPRQAVVLDSETLKFTARANDDFGIRRIGLMWRGLDMGAVEHPASGERPLAAGDFDTPEVEAIGTFCATTLGIEAQPIEVFVWAEDFLPGRNRIYSPPHVLYVLTPDQHAIWMNEQLSKWHRQALDVRDRERQLYEKNKELRDMSAAELDTAENRREIERQASAETSNGRRLDRLGKLGDELVLAASRNPEIGVGHLERWAEMLQVLKDLSQNRMPSVADLLDNAAEQPSLVDGRPRPDGEITPAKPTSVSGPKAGKNLAAGGGKGAKPFEGKAPSLRNAPSLVDMESSANSPDEGNAEPGPPKKPSSPSLRLPTTTVMGKSQPKQEQPPQAQQESMDKAVEEQADVLAEFDRLADELNAVLANLEGSTLVKRLKAASRQQNVVAGRLTDQLQPAFGVSRPTMDVSVRDELDKLQETEASSVTNVSYIMDDLAAYFERRRFMRFKATLDEMKQADVIGGLRQLSTELVSKQGLSVAQAEYWSDAMDRWAENLVDPACSGSCPGGKSPESLPPSIVLEVLQILEAEVNLREETRVAEQAKPAMKEAERAENVETLASSQDAINERVVKVIARIEELPDARKHFGKELQMLAAVDQVMSEATGILKNADTGALAIAAETEAIELILRSKRINPKGGGGGGGSSPGGGGSGNTTDSALALVGKGRNEKEVRENREVGQTTGESGAVLPEEFRRGLDLYFNRMGGS
ncbi:DUF2157 domain-containing protein [Allorhodopirellula heiligendammensis]|uniref:Uncharacterized protein n=1 Tax=Allorhodopirellula heiligendammensis TaxID=2714739 RepID=A0A5C6C1B5_9BACT|nr:DUF2157 domain-containing protein [Allorhodopirellula heiligendammensis]TWU17922.1 hypothetical protein Poly21_00740 [Allorhodopirellula heiligendammensis]